MQIIGMIAFFLFAAGLVLGIVTKIWALAAISVVFMVVSFAMALEPVKGDDE